MPDMVSVIFDRWDRFPSDHEYGEVIDRRLDRIAGGGINRNGPDPRVPIQGFAASLELHETGPVFVLDPSDLSKLTPILDDIRAMARDWANRSSGGQPTMLSMEVRYGPVAAGTGEYYPWQRIKVTTDPLTLAEHIDELIEFVVRIGRA